MTLSLVKEKLHKYIESAGEAEAEALLFYIEQESQSGEYVDDETLSVLEERWEKYLSGKTKTYSQSESIELLKANRAKK